MCVCVCVCVCEELSLKKERRSCVVAILSQNFYILPLCFLAYLALFSAQEHNQELIIGASLSEPHITVQLCARYIVFMVYVWYVRHIQYIRNVLIEWQ